MRRIFNEEAKQNFAFAQSFDRKSISNADEIRQKKRKKNVESTWDTGRVPDEFKYIKNAWRVVSAFITPSEVVLIKNTNIHLKRIVGSV